MITDTLRYTITIINRGNIEITNLIPIDKLDKRLELVPDRVRINGGEQLQGRVDIGRLILRNLPAPTDMQTMTYTIILNNIGNVLLKGILLSDIVPANLTLNPSTIEINGVPVSGATVGEIDYNSIFNKRPCIQNMAIVTYHYV